MKNHFFKYSSLLLVSILSFVSSCSDEMDIFNRENVIVGEEAIIDIEYQVGESSVATRADMAAGRDREINSIWIGFFDENGNLHHAKTFNPNSNNDEHIDNINFLRDVEITSGTYYIAAVANYKGNLGVVNCDTKKITTPTSLDIILNGTGTDRTGAISTFDEFKGIAITRINGVTGNIDTPTGNIPMQGVFIPTGSTCSGTAESINTFLNTTKYVKPSNNVVEKKYTLEGVIHFKRVISQVKFNVTFNNANLENFEIVQARVFNIPSASWLAERNDEAQYVNAGDIVDIVGNSKDETPFKAEVAKNYLNSSRILPTAMTKSGDNYSFDWWQLENRRYSKNEGLSIYQKREEEYKDNGLNTGVYIALSNSVSPVDADNCATFLELRARMDLKKSEEGVENIHVDAIYTIHLGYCEGNDEAVKAKDFNCRRNYKYTYNVKINSADNIEVEAKSDKNDEPETGAEGAVTKVTTKFYEADAHYQIFNVQLSNVERSTADWQMRIYKSQYDYVDIDSKDETYKNQADKYWKWIEICPTSGENDVAEYKPVGGKDSKTFTLDKLRDVVNYPGNNNNKTTTDNTEQWYTVFVNEYVYEDGDGSVTPNWTSYVNLPERTFWLKVEEQRSSDKESVIFTSKYAIRQKSIQTYFGTPTGVNGYGIGLENIDETSKLSLAYQGGVANKDNLDSRSLNMSYIKAQSSDMAWSDFISSTKIQKVEDEEVNIYYINPVIDNNKNENIYTERICLAKNRDLNGNGTIDSNEVRWFLPSVKQYVQFATGAPSLTFPLYNFSKYSTNETSTPTLHYNTIDKQKLWSEEGLSTGNSDNYIYYNYGVRCARYLGNDDLNKTDTNIEIPAFELKDGKYIEFHYASESIRGAITSTLPWHYINSEYNRPSKKIEIYKTDNDNEKWYWEAGFSGSNASVGNTWFSYLESTNPCEKLNTEETFVKWRIPNQCEITAILFSGVELKAENKFNSCTREFFGNHRPLGVTSEIATAGAKGTNYFLCVRDVIE